MTAQHRLSQCTLLWVHVGINIEQEAKFGKSKIYVKTSQPLSSAFQRQYDVKLIAAAAAAAVYVLLLEIKFTTQFTKAEDVLF